MSDTATSPLFLAVPETARLLGVSDDLVYDLIARAELPAATFGRRRMVPRQAIDRIVERALESFDPDAVLGRLTAAEASSIEGASGTVGSDTEATTPPTSVASPEAPT